MSIKPAVTADRLRELLNYDPETGVFTWRVNRGRGRAGKPAGAVNHALYMGYVQIFVDGRFYYGHRLAWFYVHGEWPPDTIDHIDLNPANNAIANLRLATQSQNRGNMRRHKNNTSGSKGVSWDKSRRKWFAQIIFHWRPRFLGRFKTAEEAHEAYKRAAAEQWGEFARTE